MLAPSSLGASRLEFLDICMLVLVLQLGLVVLALDWVVGCVCLYRRDLEQFSW